MVEENNIDAMNLVDPCDSGNEHTYNDTSGSMWFSKRTHVQYHQWIHVVYENTTHVVTIVDNMFQETNTHANVTSGSMWFRKNTHAMTLEYQ